MLYSVRGNARQIFSGFNYPDLVAETSSRGILEKDLFLRTNFLGTEAQAKQHVALWQQNDLEQHYAQGNMSGGILSCLLARLSVEERREPNHRKYVSEHFAYLDNQQQASGLIILYRPEQPSQWMIGLIKNPQAAPEEREVFLLSSFDLSVCIENSEFDIPVVATTFAENPLMEHVDSLLVSALLQNVLNDAGEINPHFSRLRLILQTIHHVKTGGVLKNPINFSEFDWSQLFAENPVLDLFVQYKIPLSFAMLKECLQENSRLVNELQQINPCEDKKLYENLVRMTLVFYEEHTLESNRELLNEHELIKTLGGSLWNKTQISLIPFMRAEAYDIKLMQLILSDDAYFNAVYKVAQFGWKETLLTLFQDLEKRHLLTEINSFSDEDCRALCLIFWVKSSHTVERYREIETITERYPLMASTLIALDKTGTITLDNLSALIANPKAHLKKTIKFHFFPKDADKIALGQLDLNVLTVDELDAATKALSLLKIPVTRATETYYHLLNKELNEVNNILLQLKKGELVVKTEALPLLQEELETTQKELLQIKNDPNSITAAVFNSIKGRTVRKLLPQLMTLDTERLAAGALLEQAEKTARTSYRQVLSLDAKGRSLRLFLPQLAVLEDEVQRKSLIDIFHNHISYIEHHWTEQELRTKALHFQKIIVQVERQCVLVAELSSKTMKPLEVEQALQHYRIALYCIAYDGLMGKTDYTSRLKLAEKELLTIIDPPIQSAVQKVLLIIANILIGVFTLGIAPLVKWHLSGHALFFAHNKAGEQIHELGRAMMSSVLPPQTEETMLSSFLRSYP